MRANRFDARELREDNGTGAAILPSPVALGDLCRQHPQLRPPVIEGLLREGETCGIHAKTKIGKSWTAYSIALAVASGYHWLGRFATSPGRVLIVDNELHPENLANRIPAVAKAMHLQPGDYEDSVEVLSLRGRLMDIHGLQKLLSAIEAGTYRLIVLDALYRAIPTGTSENDNSQIAIVMNCIDAIARETGAAVMFVHHATKGGQADKDVTDIGSGAGSLSRAVDSHIVLRPHEEAGHVVMDAALRSWAPVEPIVLRWEFPVWRIAEAMDPMALKRPVTRGESQQSKRDREGMQKIADAISEKGAASRKQIRTATGMGLDRVNKLLRAMLDDGEIIIAETTAARNGEPTERFALGVRDGGT